MFFHLWHVNYATYACPEIMCTKYLLWPVVVLITFILKLSKSGVG